DRLQTLPRRRQLTSPSFLCGRRQKTRLRPPPRATGPCRNECRLVAGTPAVLTGGRPARRRQRATSLHQLCLVAESFDLQQQLRELGDSEASPRPTSLERTGH